MQITPRRSATIITAVTAALAISACGGSNSLSEEGIEQLIENETGEDVEFDFNSDGGFSFESDEGSIQIGEDGSFVIEGDDGEVFSGESNDGGLTITDGDGTAVIDFDSDGDGGFSAQSEDGSFSSGQGIPEAWPAGVPRPEGLSDVVHSVISSEDGMFVSVNGMSPMPFDYFENYEGALEASNHARANYFEGDGFRQGTYSGPMYDVTVVADSASNNVGITVMEMQS